MANNMENNIENKMDMKGDDAAMVDDILNSLRDDGSANDQMQQQMPPNMQMQPSMEEIPPEVDVEYDNNDSKVNTVLSMLKKPLIVIALAFILFNPLSSDMLAKYFPTVFGMTNSLIRKQVRVLCLALILGLLFLGINNVL